MSNYKLQKGILLTAIKLLLAHESRESILFSLLCKNAEIIQKRSSERIEQFVNKNLTEKYIFGYNSTEVIEGKSILYINVSIRRIVCNIQTTINDFKRSNIRWICQYKCQI